MSDNAIMRADQRDSGARIIAQPYLDGGPRLDAMAPAGSTILEIVAIAIPGVPEPLLPHVRVTIGETVIPREMWTRVRPKPTTIVIVRVAPGNRGALRAALSIAVGVAALAVGQVWVAPLVAGAYGAAAGAIAGGLATGTVLLAGTFLINSLVPLRQDQTSGAGIAQSPTYSIQGFRNVANPDGVVPCVLGRTRFAPPYAALPYTEVSGGETYIRALFLVGYGPVQIGDIRLGDTPIENFKEVEYELREGWPDDLPVTLYPTQVLEERLSVDLNQAYVGTYGPHTRFTASDADEVSIDIAFANGLFWMHTVTFGSTTTTFPLPLTVVIRIRMRLNGTGAWTDVVDWSISAFTQKPYSASYRWTLPARGRYEIEVTRLTGDFDDLNAYQQNDQFVSVSLWSAIRSFRPEYPLNFNHPLALIAVRARASKQLNGVIDNLNCIAYRVCLDWDSEAGEWVSRTTTNPASSLRYAMQGPAMAYPLTDDEVDLEGLADLHEFCGAKGLEYNRVHDFEQSAYDAWSDIAAAGRASPRDDGERWGVVIDRPQTIVMQHITARNSWGFSGSRDYVRFPDAFRVKFYDETNSGKLAERVVPWPAFVGDPVVTESIELPGITNPDALWIEARRRQYELIHRRDVINVTQDFEGAVARRGDLILLNHDVLKRTQISARVGAVSGNAVTLDDIVTMETGKTYAIRFRKLPASEGDDLNVLRGVTLVVGESQTVYLTGTGEVPNIGDLAMFGESDSATKEMIVREVEGAEDLSRRFTLVDHAPQIEALADAETPPAWNGRVGESYDPAASGPPVPELGLIISYSDDDLIETTVFVPISIGAGGGETVGFEIEHRLVGAGSWTTEEIAVGSGGLEIPGYAHYDTIEIRARAIGGGDTPLYSDYTATTPHIVALSINSDFGSIADSPDVSIDLGSIASDADQANDWGGMGR